MTGASPPPPFGQGVDANALVRGMKIGVEPLTPRRISSLLNELDTLGLIMARNVSKGRGGRSKQVNSAIPKAIDAIGTMSGSEPLIG